MNASTLAKMMLQWETQKRRLNELEQAIRDSVLQIGKTQTVGNVRATYSKGRKKFDYKEAWKRHGYYTDIDIEKYKKVTYDYRAICRDASFDQDEIPFTESPPSVSVKLLE